MRVVMPLFEFECSNIESYSFGDCGIAIQPLKENDLDLAELSKLDAHHINSASWALIYDGEDTAYRSIVNLLLMSFRIFLDHSPPFIKYRLSKENNQATSINQSMTYNYSAEKERVAYEKTDFMQVEVGFQRLRKMDAT